MMISKDRRNDFYFGFSLHQVWGYIKAVYACCSGGMMVCTGQSQGILRPSVNEGESRDNFR